MKSFARILPGLLLIPCLSASPPNILLIFADDLGFGDVGYSGKLHDLAVDPGETVNLVERYREKASELKRLLDETRESGPSAPAAR